MSGSSLLLILPLLRHWTHRGPIIETCVVDYTVFPPFPHKRKKWTNKRNKGNFWFTCRDQGQNIVSLLKPTTGDVFFWSSSSWVGACMSSVWKCASKKSITQFVVCLDIIKTAFLSLKIPRIIFCIQSGIWQASSVNVVSAEHGGLNVII